MERRSFKELGVIEPILKSIREQNFTEPTEIQARTIPLVVRNRDVIGGSRTGSGKTLAFCCGIIKKAEAQKGIQAVVLVPTRELNEQVAKAFRIFSKYKRLNIVTVYGGVAIGPQIEKLQKAEIVIATPGRMLDHIERNTINLTKVNTLVLDEADMMLDMGFLPDVEKIIRHIPRKRQTLLFSATMTSDIQHLTRKHMFHPVKVSADEYVDPSKLKQVYYDVPSKQKFSLLVHLLKKEEEGLVMVFCNTRENTDFVARNLKVNGVNSCAIHGGLTQHMRTTILQKFHEGKVYALICTDVASRGLDIKGVSHIYNYDTCKDPKQYIHRIGRTARAGKDGKAITLLSDRDHDNFRKVLYVNRVGVQREKTPYVERAMISFKTAPRGQRFGRRPSGPRHYGGQSGGRPGYHPHRGPRRHGGQGQHRGGRPGQHRPTHHGQSQHRRS
ncbi:DEAD/DEAH box helicase [Candidatus Woesearchaeota archaeon]|nr:DEAD/DEAH box helicase [Candidatus Woesearchaeota archaeon]